MSRRLVSYSDLTEDVPPPAVGEAGPSSHPLHGGNAGGKRKRNAADAHTKGGKRSGMKREMVHWDDPDYVSESSAGVGGYRDEVRDGVDVEEVFDGRGDESAEEGYAASSSHEQPYSNWKYDEWGERYTSDSHRSATYDLEDDSLYHDEDYDHDNDEIHDDDEDDSFEDPPLPFAIPDVDEYHRTHPSSTTILTSTHSNPPHRPPHAVGGGGRTLTHTEIWGPTTLIQAFNAALSQYCHLHNLASPSPAVDSALWTEAPAHDSLLAQQVREDTRQILAQRRPASNLTLEGAAEEVGKNRGKKGKSEPAKQQQQKKKVTIVPHAELEGNSAWKKAVKTVQTTPNQIGVVVDKALPVGNVDEGLIDRVDQVEAEDAGEKHKQLHAWWYAGYQAGIAAASHGKPAVLNDGDKAAKDAVASTAQADDTIAHAT